MEAGSVSAGKTKGAARRGGNKASGTARALAATMASGGTDPFTMRGKCYSTP